jgi:hypothetical protein
MFNLVKLSATAAAISLLAACSGGSTVLTPANQTHTGGSATTYTQIERLSRPAIKEAFEPFQDHQISNAVEPYNDPTIQNDIIGTEDFVRPTTSTTDYGKTIASVVYPDEYLVNLAGSAPSGADPYYFLSTEVTGGTAFGGRAPNDNVIDLELGVLFGGTLPALGLIADDKEENNCLSQQNVVADASKSTTSTFPYLPAPH